MPQVCDTFSASDSLGQRYLNLLFQGGTEFKSVPELNSIESVIRFAVSNQVRQPSAPDKDEEKKQT